MAAVKPAPIFGDNMALQANMKLPVWGKADPQEAVTVKFLDQTRQATADESGKWRVDLDPVVPGGPHEMTVSSPAGEVQFKNVVVGEVWLGSGQSNMEMSVQRSNNAEKEIADAKFPMIRLFTVVKDSKQTEPTTELKGEWVECSPQTVGRFSAVAYFFGRDLHQELNEPVGLIHSSWGGTPAQSWTSREALEADPKIADYFESWTKSMQSLPDRMAKWEKDVKTWDEQAKAAKAAGKPEPAKPRKPQGTDSPHRPTSLFNGMISPLIPYAIRGAIWYQGESNAGDYARYSSLFPAMITDWRQRWGEGDFPFLFVQLANFMKADPQPSDTNWARVREAQQAALKLPNTGMAVIIDIGEGADIHPKNKQDVGHRLAKIALANSYGKKIEFSGPVLDSMKVEGDATRLSFSHADSKLKAIGGEGLRGFAIAGEDQVFHWADEAWIDPETNTVVVRSAAVSKPVAVRYNWADNPNGNLYNGEELPAVPFRTDDWPKK